MIHFDDNIVNFHWPDYNLCMLKSQARTRNGFFCFYITTSHIIFSHLLCTKIYKVVMLIKAWKIQIPVLYLIFSKAKDVFFVLFLFLNFDILLPVCVCVFTVHSAYVPIIKTKPILVKKDLKIVPSFSSNIVLEFLFLFVWFVNWNKKIFFSLFIMIDSTSSQPTCVQHI